MRTQHQNARFPGILLSRSTTLTTLPTDPAILAFPIFDQAIVHPVTGKCLIQYTIPIGPIRSHDAGTEIEAAAVDVERFAQHVSCSSPSIQCASPVGPVPTDFPRLVRRASRLPQSEIAGVAFRSLTSMRDPASSLFRVAVAQFAIIRIACSR